MEWSLRPPLTDWLFAHFWGNFSRQQFVSLGICIILSRRRQADGRWLYTANVCEDTRRLTIIFTFIHSTIPHFPYTLFKWTIIVFIIIWQLLISLLLLLYNYATAVGGLTSAYDFHFTFNNFQINNYISAVCHGEAFEYRVRRGKRASIHSQEITLHFTCVTTFTTFALRGVYDCNNDKSFSVQVWSVGWWFNHISLSN